MSYFTILFILMCLQHSNQFTQWTKTPSITNCVSVLVKKAFLPEATINFIFESYTNAFLPINVENPRMIITLDKKIDRGHLFQTSNNYIIYTKSYDAFNDNFIKLKYSSIWNESESPKGTFLVVVSTDVNDEQEAIFEFLWSYDIVNVILVAYKDGFPKIYVFDPLEVGRRCFKKPKLQYPQNCHDNVSLSTFKFFKKLEECPIKMVSRYKVSANKDMDVAPINGILISIIELIAEIMKTNLSVSYKENEKNSLYNRSEDISLIPEIARSVHLLNDYDLSELIYRDEVVWVVPKPGKISNVGIIGNVFERNVWGVIIGVLIVITLIWWSTAHQLVEHAGFNSLPRCFLTIWAFSVCSSSNIKPNSDTLRLLAVFYLFYCTEIYNAFQGKLMSLMTSPGDQRSMSTMQELAASNLPAIVHETVDNLNISAIYNKEFAEIKKRFLVQRDLNVTDNLLRVAYYRNCSTHVGRRLLNNLYPKEKVMVDIIDSNTGLLEAEIIVAMRKGHYFMNTFNKLSRRIIETGFHEKVLSDAARKYRIDQEEAANIILTIGHLHGIFVWWIVGLVCGIGVFAAELIILRFPENYNYQFHFDDSE